MTVLDALPPVPAPQVWNGTVEGWHDGDTVHVWVDRGRGDYSRWAVRLRGAALRELDEPGGPEAADHLNALVPAGTRVVLVNVDDDKYGGRTLAHVIVADRTGRSVDLGQSLVLDGWAAPWDGRGKQPAPAWPRIPRPREEVIA